MKTLNVTLLYVQYANEVLLGMKKAGHGKGKWNGFGGKIEPSESAEQAMIRECQEEAGITPLSYEPVGHLGFFQMYKGSYALISCNVYTCSEWEGEPKETTEMKPRWFPVHKLPWNEMWRHDKHFLPSILAGKKVRAIFQFDEKDSLIQYSVDEVTELA